MPTKVGLKRSQSKLFQLKISLVDSPLPIWRRVKMPADLPLHIAHDMLQLSMGWTNSHLHEFQAFGKRYGQLETAEHDPKLKDEQTACLADLLKSPGDTAIYLYDLGDGWEHEMLLEKVSKHDPTELLLARCTAGKRACPPEDIGGVSGYRSFLNCIEDPESPDRAEMLTWIGSEFDPDSFDARSVNLQYRMIEQDLEDSMLSELNLSANT